MTEAIQEDKPEQPELKRKFTLIPGTLAFRDSSKANGNNSTESDLKITGNSTDHSTSSTKSPSPSVKKADIKIKLDPSRFESVGIKTRKSIPENFETHENPTFEPSKNEIESIPTYHLTQDQYEDPITFIESIKEQGSKYGAVKIIPPSSFDTEFKLDFPRLKFRAAKQSLNHPTSNFNEKVQFYKDLLAFHKSKKLPLLRLPSIDRRVLDLFKLRNSVHLKGGFELVCRKKLWAQIGRELGYTGRIMTSLSTSLKSAYQKVVHSYDLYLEGKEVETSELTNGDNKRPLENEQDSDTKRIKVENQVLEVKDPVPTVSNSRKVFKRSRDILKSKGFKTNFESYTEEKQGITQVDDYTYPYYDFSYWHKGVEVLDFPFPSTEMTQLYTLDEFYDNHLKFKESLFKEDLSDDELLKKYWELIDSKSSDFNVESATNLSTTVHGSGFPTMAEFNSFKTSDITNPWNLNNLPLNEKGLMRYLVNENESISKPVLDIGMLYSTQSWAMEDHFLYSANYQHVGSSQVWYFISAQDQEKFEKILSKYIKSSESNAGSGIIKHEFPEPVASDVLDTIKAQDQFSHRADTTNPSFQKLYSQKSDLIRFNSDIFIPFSILKENDIKVHYTIQKPGQFIIKFPKTYSATVSLGFNINEHVNFATVSWLDHALDAEKWLHSQGLLPCISFFQLLTSIAEDSKDSALLKKVLPYYNEMIERQFELRSELKSTVSNLKTVNNKFDYLSDDDLSVCFPTKIVVTQGNDSFNLEPENFIKLYKSGKFEDLKDLKFEMHVYYSDDRLKTFQRTISTYAQTPKDWVAKFEELLSSNTKPPIRALRTLLAESERIMGDIPEADVLKVYLADANDWIEKAQDVLSVKQKNRIRNRRGSIKEEQMEPASTKPETIEKLINEIPSLSFTCPEIDQLVEFANEIYQFEVTVRGFLTDSGHTLDEFYDMIDLGKSFGVELNSVDFLERIVNRLEWVTRAEETLEKSTDLEQFESVLDEGYKIGSGKDEELINKVVVKFKNGKYMNAKFKHYLSLPSLSISIVEMLLQESTGLPIDQDVKKQLQEIKDKHSKSVEERDQIYKVIAKNGVEMYSLRDERQKKLSNDPTHNVELYEKLLSKFQGDEQDIRPKYSFAKEILEKSRQFLPSNPSDPLDNYLRQTEDWLRRSKRLFGKTNAPFSVLRSHLNTILEKDKFCFSQEDVYIVDLKEEDHKIYCFCRRLESGTMIACERCLEWYHCKCLKFGRGKSKNVENYICPICDYRIEIPREYNSPKIEDLENMIEEGSFLELAPDELYLVKSIYNDAYEFRKYLRRVLKWEDGEIIETDTNKLKFYLRKLEGASVLLSDEYNKLRQLIYKLDPICDTAPPIVESSNKTKKRRKPVQPLDVPSTTPDTMTEEIPAQPDEPKPLTQLSSVENPVSPASGVNNPDSTSNEIPTNPPTEPEIATQPPSEHP